MFIFPCSFFHTDLLNYQRVYESVLKCPTKNMFMEGLSILVLELEKDGNIIRNVYIYICIHIKIILKYVVSIQHIIFIIIMLLLWIIIIISIIMIANYYIIIILLSLYYYYHILLSYIIIINCYYY